MNAVEPNPAPGIVHDNDMKGRRKHRKMLRRLASRPANKMPRQCKWYRNYVKRA